MTDHNNRSIFQQNDASDWMLYEFHIEDTPDILAYKYSRYPNTYCQYGSYDTQQTAKEIHEILKKEFPSMSFNAIVVVRTGAINGSACYDHITNNLFAREELSNPVKFQKIVDKSKRQKTGVMDSRLNLR